MQNMLESPKHYLIDFPVYPKLTIDPQFLKCNIVSPRKTLGLKQLQINKLGFLPADDCNYITYR